MIIATIHQQWKTRLSLLASRLKHFRAFLFWLSAKHFWETFKFVLRKLLHFWANYYIILDLRCFEKPGPAVCIWWKYKYQQMSHTSQQSISQSQTCQNANMMAQIWFHFSKKVQDTLGYVGIIRPIIFLSECVRGHNHMLTLHSTSW